ANSADIAQVVADGKVEAVTISYNAVNFAYRRTGMAAAHDLGLGVVVMNPLGGGLIPQHPDRFAFLNENTGDSIAVAAMKFLLGHKEITCSLPGIATSAELNELMLSLENIPKVDDAYCNNLATKLSDEFDALCTSCQYCESCPVNIPITKFMDSYNGVLLGDGKSAAPAHNKLKYFWDVDHKLANGCTGCGICEELCTQKLPIADRMRHIGDFDPE
ncbi:MAG: 4Fe-4S dicluster domain-containing protein, partial [Defluviitaleaceae bacterium]|nr:4Fe-4S dicluster domain-containing protein [Defluviitaleaceae bacterium]